MKKLIFVFLIMVLAGCSNNQDKYYDFDYSFARSGGISPIYENLLIKGNKVHYSFEGQGKNIKKEFVISNEDLQKIENTLTQNKFAKIQEDYKKLYDNISVEINVKKGNNAGSKSDASLIMQKNQQHWDKIVSAFQQIIDSNINSKS
ncbi:membrane lipoprotein lipid attachment site-containing protein [Kaistella sp.]|uniref:membrane lipoprotein lipid attachment site-containing protein n=1 Tax=Kaistella sp. TaxID=2782235 RepID=UPI003C45655B